MAPLTRRLIAAIASITMIVLGAVMLPFYIPPAEMAQIPKELPWFMAGGALIFLWTFNAMLNPGRPRYSGKSVVVWFVLPVVAFFILVLIQILGERLFGK
jgi:peptidoglycan/LPS O-acetylase OafA/YrhL